MPIAHDKQSYPLSPLQEGMLFHAVSEAGSGVDIEQIICSAHEPMDVHAFRQAWAKVVDRHAILRTGFQREGLDEPRQFIEPIVEVPFQYDDLGNGTEEQQGIQVDNFVQEDRDLGFDLTKPPLMRLTVFQKSEDVYTFVWTFHHILLDGRSFPIVLEEVFQFYEALCDGREWNPPPPRPYRAYIEWLSKRDLKRDEEFWRQYLAGFQTPTTLSGTKSLGTIRHVGDEGGIESRLGAALTARLEDFATKNEVSVGNLIQASWALLLHSYIAEADIVFGITRSGRHAPLEGIESMVGLLINSLPFRVQISADESVLSLLKQVRAQTIKIRDFEQSPLHSIQQWSDVAPGRPLFESLVVFENYLLDSYLRRKGGKWSRREFAYRGRTNYPLTLLAYNDEDMLLRIEYDRDRFDPASIQRMMGQLEVVLERMIDAPAKPVGELSILNDVERQQVLTAWNATQVDYPLDTCLPELFEAQVQRTPDNTALVFREQHLTYRQLNERANQLAHHLRKLGVGPETNVGLCVERSLEMVIGIYGIQKAGAAYVPVDPEYPRERLAFLLKDTGAPVLLTQSHLMSELPPYNGIVICLDADWAAISKEPTTNVNSGLTSENLAYVIYTSGSTGQPKGVMNEHQGIVNRLLWMQDQYKLTEADAVLQKTPFSFDVSVWEFFWPLLCGARLVIAEPNGHRDTAYLTEVINKEKITTLHFVPSMLQMFLDDDAVGTCTTIERVICSGEALPFAMQQKFFDKLNAELHNLYGPTEAAVDVTFWACQRESSLSIVPIGRPVANTQIYILNESMQPVPIGACGELYIGGVQVARGYLNRTELTAEKFVPNPFDEPQSNSRLYKTGDLGRFLPDGNIEYLGRNDFQVKIRGQRIELGEIERVLTLHPAVREAVVVARDDAQGDQRLVAYWTTNLGSKCGADELREFLKVKLPNYMVPDVFVQQEAFPLTPSGKIDRKRLPVPSEPSPTGRAYQAPANRIEQEIATAWQIALGVEKVGVHDNFFDLGGNSLSLMRVRNKLSETVKKDIRIAQMFDLPTIADLARFLADETDEKKGTLAAARIQQRAAKQREMLKLRQRSLGKKANE